MDFFVFFYFSFSGSFFPLFVLLFAAAQSATQGPWGHALCGSGTGLGSEAGRQLPPPPARHLRGESRFLEEEFSSRNSPRLPLQNKKQRVLVLPEFHCGFLGRGHLNPNCFCSRRDTDAHGPLDAVLMPTTRVCFKQIRFNASILQNGVSPLIFYSFSIWAQDFSASHTQTLINRTKKSKQIIF